MARFRRLIARLFLVAPLLTAAALTSAAPAVAATGPWSQGEAAKVRLLSAATAAGDAETLRFGLEFQLEPGWKIYWRTPGDAGLPPIPDWSASGNVRDVAMEWPVPARFEIFEIGTLGYEDRVVFPLSVAPVLPGAPVQLRGGIDYLACAEICIPGRAEVALDLPAGTPSASASAHDIDTFRAAVPATEPVRAGLSITDAAVSARADGSVEVALAVASLSGGLDAPDAYLEGPGGAYFGKPEVARTGQSAVLRFTAPARMDLAALDGADLTVTLLDDGRALETKIAPRQGTLTVPETAATPIWTILGLAVLGGLILNLMPCVLPVLSLKLMSVLRKSGKEAGQIRAGFLAAAAGILVSFAVLAGGAIALKLTGMQVGWGIQFQQPIFLALMVALLTLFACNLAGLFDFHLPGALGDRAARAGGQGLFGDFLTGAFATLLATPCSAPFLGTAVGFALSAGPGEILAVFLALGLGLALPYLAIAAVPGAVRFLPKPGRWMLWLKAVLALALVGTAVWLLTVLSALVGAESAIAVGALAATAAAALATKNLPGSRLGRAAWPVSAALAAATVLSPLAFDAAPADRPTAQAEAIDWRPFDEAAIPGLLADGKTVLVDVTADWCVTCQWNKKTVLEAGDVADWLDRSEVVAMKADWTRPDPVIAEYLARFGRYGIPFNIVYGPDAPQGIPLPELLSADAVLSAAAAADTDSAVAAAQ